MGMGNEDSCNYFAKNICGIGRRCQVGKLETHERTICHSQFIGLCFSVLQYVCVSIESPDDSCKKCSCIYCNNRSPGPFGGYRPNQKTRNSIFSRSAGGALKMPQSALSYVS